MDTIAWKSRFRIVVPCYPSFNIYSKIARHTTALGPVCVGTVVSHMPGWDVEIIDENNYRKYGPRDVTGHPDHDTLQAIRPADVVGLYGGLSSTAARLYKLARFYKAKGITTIGGGQHFSLDNVDEGLANGIDTIVLGEGEDTIRETLSAIQSNIDLREVSGIAFKRNGQTIRTPERPPIADFERLPLPDFSLLRYAKIKYYPVSWTRGCGMDCEFCTVRGRPRSATVERVFEQVATLVEKHDARRFFIVDDLFGHCRKETIRLCHMLAHYQESIGVKLGITVQIRLDYATDSELLHAMRQANVTTVCIGYESPIAEELKAMSKRTKPDEMLALTRLYHKRGFLVHGMFIFGYPLPKGVTLNLSLKQRVRCFRTFIRRARLDTIQVLLPVPLPGTALAERLAAQGRLYPRDSIGWEYYDGNFPVFTPDEPLSPEDMQLAIRTITGRFYRFRSMFVVGLNILLFPAIILSFRDIRSGWQTWYRAWRNALRRFGGWTVFRSWTTHYKTDNFSRNLAEAKKRVQADSAMPGHAVPPPPVATRNSARSEK